MGENKENDWNSRKWWKEREERAEKPKKNKCFKQKISIEII